MARGIPTYTPSLVFSCGKKQTFYSLSDGSYETGSDPELRGRECIYSCHGWLLMRSYSSTKCYLYNPVSSTKIHLPLVPNTSYGLGVLTSIPSDPNCFSVLYSWNKNSLIFCRIGDTEWIEQKLRRGKNVPKVTKYHTMICCRGRVYLFGAGKMEEVDVHDAYASVKSYELGQFDSFFQEYAAYYAYFVESGGEIFQVHLGQLSASTEITWTCDVYKLDLSTMDWLTVDTLGDRIFLLGRLTSVSTNKIGLQGNCIYFKDDRTTCVYKFDMYNKTITTASSDKKLPHWNDPFWVVPNFTIIQVHKRVLRIRAPMVEVEDELHDERSWKCLPEELLELILFSLSGVDRAHFRLTCKTWVRVRHHPHRYESFLTQSNSNPKNLPCLLSLPRSKTGLCNFYYPVHNSVAYFINNLEIAGAMVRDAKYGWLLMSRGYDAVFFLNPLTTEIIILPNLEEDYISISFSSPPTSAGCIVFGLLDPAKSNGHMVVFRKLEDKSFDDDNNYENGDKFWSAISYSDPTKISKDDIFLSVPIEVPHEFVASESCNSVLCNGKFYCLGKDGKLACFDPDEKDRKRIWRVLPVLSFSQSTNYDKYIMRSFLVGNKEEMYSVFVDHVWGKSVHVYKLNWDELRWVQVESLGDYVFFLSPARSMMVPAAIKGMGNRIYFPKFCSEDNIMYYSLSTRKYHFGINDCRDGWTGSCEHWNCSWIDFSEQHFCPSKLYTLFEKICDFFKTFKKLYIVSLD